jgi:uncharacterized protein YkwD
MHFPAGILRPEIMGRNRRIRNAGLLGFTIALPLLFMTGCGGPQVQEQQASTIGSYPSGRPAAASRLKLASPGDTDKLAWWRDNILSLLPEGIYSTQQQSDTADSIIANANAARQAMGLQPLKRLPLLDRVAQAHAMDQAIRLYWNHKTPEGLGSHDRIAAAGGPQVTEGGENSSVVYLGHLTGPGVITGWENSPPHRALLFDPKVRYCGAGVYRYSDREYEHYVMLLVNF